MQRSDLAERFERVPQWVWFALALLLQVMIIGSLVLTHYTTTVTGRPVVLKLAPVDPRDPLRGDYLTFRYDISRLRSDLFLDPSTGSASTPTKGETVFVPLMREGTYWVAVPGVSSRLPGPGGDAASGYYPPDAVFIKGAVTEIVGSEVHVTYGIEEYFVPEGKAASFPPNKQGSALVVVGKDGKPLIKQVFVEGRVWP